MKKPIWIIVIGLFLLALDVLIPVGDIYPVVVRDPNLGEVLQNNLIYNFIGTRPMIDIFSDLIGHGFIFVGSCMLVKHNKRFLMVLIFAPIAMFLYAYTPFLPYYFDTVDLYAKTSSFHFAVVFVEIAVEYYIIHGIVLLTKSHQNRIYNNEMLAGWIGAVISKLILVGIDFFYGRNLFYAAYSIVLIGLTVFYVNRMFKTLEIIK